ncbi:XAP5-domain-containing protein [Xylona heveae TC161]|uniref:XAP5-domain-containing protein n=1 Tax=Xylona heveae (strain CBS 132557 / TC161) TaxID=1328760 RepID=A0A164ZNL6_XYLHT|nr:XAP5-domain-containing protein [Xylona heveae TC161]KZF19315.1 XAP5-domain-containing protein [Xylona heveae TC161]
MSSSRPPSNPSSRSSTPNPANSRFTSQSTTAEDLLKSQTVGLVHLSDFKKRRVEVLEQKEREAQDRTLGIATPSSASGAATPSERGSTPQPPKKKKKTVAKGKLSFGLDDEEEDSSTSTTASPKPGTPDVQRSESTSPNPEDGAGVKKKRLGPNANVTVAPKAMTKSALLREAQTREQLRKEFLVMQEAVKATEILMPFTFYDGTHIPGGVCKVRKGDHVWLFLDKARKVGAELAVGGGGEKANRREWARVGVDDLMLVKGDLIIPHHYDFYYFIVNKTKGRDQVPLFPFSSQPTSTTPSSSRPEDEPDFNPLSKPPKQKESSRTPLDPRLEGYDNDPTLTKVVDRRWYERNKHIFPASTWEEFDPTKDYTSTIRKDTEGNAFFF